MDEEWWATKINELKTKNKSFDVLTEMKANISSIPRQELERLLLIPEFHECGIIGNKSKEPLVNITKDLIDNCFHMLEMEDTSNKQLVIRLTPWLTHSNPKIRSITQGVLLKKLHDQMKRRNQQPPNACKELLIPIIDELMKKDTECGVVSITLLSLLLGYHLNDADIKDKLLQLLRQNEIIRCRGYELAVMIAKNNSTALQSIEFLLDAAIAELDNDDVLVQASVMEILVPLGKESHGVTFMESRHVFDVISSRITSLEGNAFGMLLVPSIMKFFGKIAMLQPQKIITGYPHLLDCLFNTLLADEESILPVTIDTLANLAHTDEGKQLLHEKYAQQLKQIFTKYAIYTKTMSSLVKCRLLNSLEFIFTLESIKPIDPKISGILNDWFKWYAAGENINILMDLCRTPFNDLQLAAMSYLNVLCNFPWGIAAVNNTGGAIEFLLNRTRIEDKDVKYMKWNVIQSLSASPLFTASEIVRLTAYVNEGPYYEKAEVDVAIESMGSQ